MSRLSCFLAVLATVAVGSVARAQEVPTGPCARPDSIAFRGNARITDQMLRADAGVTPGTSLNYRDLSQAIRNLYATSQFDDVRTACETIGGKTTLIFLVRERRILSDVKVTGAEKVSAASVRDKIDLLIGRAIDPAQVAKSVARIDSLYAASGYTLAKVTVDTTVDKQATTLVFRVEEGPRLHISGVDVEGNKALSDKTVVSGMSTKPEGFFWWQKGEFDPDKFSADVAQKIPELYASRGFIDMQVTQDTLIVDQSRGKALVQVKVKEGPQYKIGQFEVEGAKRFTNDEIARYYPFGDRSKSLTETVKGIFTRNGDHDVFDEAAWEDATQKVRTAYANEGYIYADVRPVVERRFGPDSTPMVDLRWEIDEKSPAIINRIDIVGNDVTVENCIRDQLFLIPGDVFNQDRLIQSWRNIANLGFFEQDMPPPDTRTVNDKGDIDLIFHVKEKRTGNVNFGASVGQGTGVGGFIGFSQPNLFGQCKQGSLQWQFGRYINDFSLSYTDPRIKESRISGTVTAYHQQSRFVISDIGTSIRTGGQVQFGMPVRGSQLTRAYISYGGERVRYGNEGLVSTITCNNCFRSTLGLTLDHDTRVGMPFPYAGTHQNIEADFNGGPLGGSAAFQRTRAEMRSYSTLATFGGGDTPGSTPLILVFGLSARAGMVFGDPGPFFVSQAFSLGGVQFGEPLRGYEEFSITPHGYLANANSYTAQRSSFGNAFYASTAELGLRVNQQLYLDGFYDAGNLWERPRDFDPTRLFRGAGVGASVVTPLGPLGIDLGYGFDRVDVTGRKDPKWQVHFKFGQIF